MMLPVVPIDIEDAVVSLSNEEPVESVVNEETIDMKEKDTVDLMLHFS